MERYEIIRFGEIDSTNNYLKSLGSEANVVAIAESQTAGRGAGTNTWESETGKNLTFSILIHPTFVRPNRQFLISMCIANAIRETVYIESSILNIQPMIKWPNDIYVGDRKLCGILIENSLKGEYIKDCVIGIGLNVNQREFLSDAPNPVSMAQVMGRDLDCEEILNQLLECFEKQLLMLENGQEKEIRRQYMEKLYRKGEMHRFKDSMGAFEATIVDVEDDGHLVVEDNLGKIRKYGFKEIEFII